MLNADQLLDSMHGITKLPSGLRSTVYLGCLPTLAHLHLKTFKGCLVLLRVGFAVSQPECDSLHRF